MVALLTMAERLKMAEELPSWQSLAAKDALFRSFRFTDFDAAFAFMGKIALVASRLDHHPDWSNVYNRVDVVLSTHECGGISDRDWQLARQIDALYGLGPGVGSVEDEWREF